MLPVQVLRQLLLAPSPGDGGDGALSAASGVAQIGRRLFVVADDELSLGVFDLSHAAPGRRFRLFEGDLPARPGARKAAKPDFEALTLLPPSDAYPFGTLLAMGSGSRATRERGAGIALDASGEPVGPVRRIDLAPLFAPLRAGFADLNIEGAFVSGAELCLLHRGNKGAPVNACVRFDLRSIERWLSAAAPAPAASSVTRFELGAIEGVPLTFTDGAALEAGAWAFCAAAEDTADNYADGRCTGSAVGVVDANGRVLIQQRLAMACKVEGIAATVGDGALHLLLVTDADDRKIPALLLSATLAVTA